MISDNDVMTIKDAADVIGIGLATVYRHINNNKIPTVVINGKKVILKSVVESLKGNSLDKEVAMKSQVNISLSGSDKPIDINNIDNNKLSDLNNGLNIIQTRINFIKKKFELEELEGTRLKPEQLNKKEEELLECEQRLTKLETRNKEAQLRLDNELASLDLKIEELNQRYKNLEEKEAKAEAVENELKKRVIEFSNKVKKDMEVIKSKQLELDTKERDNNYSRQCLIEDIAKFNAMVDWYYRRTGIKFTR